MGTYRLRILVAFNPERGAAMTLVLTAKVDTC
nr:MAG TPA: hypothetical protein [Caudoviricetes sp.]